MRSKSLLVIPAALIVALAAMFTACDDEKVVTEEVHLLYWDVFGVVEYEADGDYPPPDNLDNLTDDNIVVTLYFGEDMAGIYQENDPYGYFITTDYNDENFSFPFVPDGQYWLNAEFTILDSCFQASTDKFFHSDTADTFQELRPEFIGTNKGCFDLILTGAQQPQEMVQINERCWVTRKVYENIIKPRRENGDLLEP